MSKKTNSELKDKISEYLSDTWEELREDIEDMAPKERAAAKLKLLDYAIPKVQAVRDTPPTSGTSVQDLLRKENNS